ncbi:MAG: (2Fe-2S)-binding protein [Bdellovibrionales bacterium]|nr:(2Fe-2S)-binding protein [Bdellovibrionales bacterium]
MTTPNLVKMKVNGQEVMLPEGKNLLQALMEDIKTEIPHFCYHPGIGPEGSCRLCLVEVTGQPKMATSCTMTVKEGLDIQTQSEVAKDARKHVLEFFLLNHPLDCPFCDKGGECPLQNYTIDAHQTESRFDFAKEQKDKHKIIGDHIILDKERCVLCNRCVRFGSDFIGKEELTIRNRGSHNEIDVPDNQPLTSGFTGNYADFCPVGALTTLEYRFKARPWEMRTVDTVCGGCSVGCNMQAWRKEKTGEVLRLTPRVNHDVNQWWLCDKGRFSIHDLPAEGDRLIEPVDKRVATDVFEKLFETIKSAKAPAFVLDQSATNEEIYITKKLANYSNATVYAPFSSRLLAFRSLLPSTSLTFGQSFDQAQSIAVLGEKLESDHPVLSLRLRRAFHQSQKSIFSYHEGENEFSDIQSVFQKISAKDYFEKKPNVDSSTLFLLSYKWVETTPHETLVSWVKSLPESSQVVLLVNGSNEVGMMDQATNMAPMDEMYQAIKNQKHDVVVLLGDMPQELALLDLSHVSTLVQTVYMASAAHPQALILLPRAFFTEKTGTFTNTFGLVQRLRRAQRVFDRKYETFEWMKAMLENFGHHEEDVTNVLGILSQEVKSYPKTLQAIVESTVTYDHYERTQWR